MLQGETCDFLESQQILGGIFTSFVSPVFIAYGLAANYPNENAAGHRIVDFQMPCAIFQAVTALYLIFASFYKSPDFMSSWWIFVGPWIHAIFTILDFIVIPIVVIIEIFFNMSAIGASSFSAGLVLFPMISVGMIIWVPIQILPIFLGAINFVKKKQREHRERRGAKTLEAWEVL